MVELDPISMSEVIYDVKSQTIKNFTYRTPSVFIDENGEPQVEYSKNKFTHVHIKSVIFLDRVGYEKKVEKRKVDGQWVDGTVKGKLLSYEPLDCVNQYTLSKHIENDKEDTAQSSKSLIHYFSFLFDQQAKWDKEYNNEDYDPLLDRPRPAWDNFGIRKSHRATYMYCKAIKEGAINGTGLAYSTTSAYMREVVNFYKYYLRLGKRFNRPPFQYETFLVNVENDGTNIKAHRRIEVQSSDLRITFPKSKKNNGGTLPNARRDLKPLTHSEWKEVENILTTTKKVIKNVKGENKQVSLPIEYSLLFLILRFSGLRREEVASLHLGQVILPDLTKPFLRLGVGEQFGSLTKGVEGINKNRRTIIPSVLMLQIYEYTKSERYDKRLKQFRDLCKAKRESGNDAFFDGVDGVDENKNYLFISNSGVPFFKKLTEINTRWSEIRKTASSQLPNNMDAVVHNLRSTFAVSIFRMLLKKMDSEKALAIVSEFLGHQELTTTMLYLRIAENHPTGDEIWEDVLDYIGAFDDIDEHTLTDSILPNPKGYRYEP